MFTCCVNLLQAAYHVRILLFIHDASVVQLDVKVLIYRMQRALDGQVVLEFHCNLHACIDQCSDWLQVYGVKQHTSLPTSVLK